MRPTSTPSAAVNAAIVTLACVLASCRVPPPADHSAAPVARIGAGSWARRTLGGLSLEEKVGQMIGVRAYGVYQHPSSAEARQLHDWVASLHVGCVVLFRSEVDSVPRLVNQLQTAAPLPLLVAADMERAMSFRIAEGVTPLPYAMAIGATRSEDAAGFAGELAAREARALGIHWAFAPVADVNSNPANPVINIRSYGEDPELVARLTAAFVRGARKGGLLTTAKHFPGHGDTAVDTHLLLATIAADEGRLEAVELRPFRAALEAGVDSVMVGHVAVPALDPSGAPATLSAPISTELLRNRLGFQGLTVTDALDMAGARAAWNGEAAIRAVQAGADMVLLPPQPEIAVQALVRAVREGQIAEPRIDASVLRILEAKERLGLDRRRLVDPEAVSAEVGRPEDVERALAIARASLTVVKNEKALLPLRAEGPLHLLHLVVSSDLMNPRVSGIPEDELRRRRVPVETRWIGPDPSEATIAQVLTRAPEFTHVLVSAYVRVTASKGTADMAERPARLVRELAGTGLPVIVVAYGSPYLIRQFPDVPAFVCAYGDAESSQQAAISALLGESPVTGRLPVTIPGLYPYGHGLSIPRRPMVLTTASPEQAGFHPQAMAEVDRVLDGFLARKAFPGGVVAVGKDGALVHLRPFGRLSYERAAPAVAADTLYDLASLTKVVATTTAAMILVDEGRLDIDQPVSAFLPGFRGGLKDKVRVSHLLTHSAGVDWWAPLFKELQGKQAYLQRIQAMDLVYEPGTKSLYSDLGLILLGEILERVAGEPLERFVGRRVLAPLGMRDTLFRPGPALRPRIAPTEQDPWRGRLLRGEVHDENAFALGGVAPHAGLFATVPDLARFAQMMLNGGVYDHQRIVSRATVERFTRRAGIPGSSRALGWDTPSAPSSAGSFFSASSFGHTGFTGTSLWVDPERRLFLILLTNRVHPTRENKLIMEARPAVADAVIQGLVNP